MDVISLLKLLSLFSGIGAFEKALNNINLEYEIINFSEIYKPAISCYCKLYNTSEDDNIGDITNVDPKKIEDFDLMTYGFPCQSFSSMGLRNGFGDSKNGNLFFESMKIVKEKKPKYLIAENVMGLLSNDNGKSFKIILEILNKLGYKNYYKILDSSNFNIPQMRKRIFIISIRKDVPQNFGFPITRKTNKTVSDIIDHKITDRYISPELEQYCNEKYCSKRNKNKNNLFDGYSLGYFKSGFLDYKIYTIHSQSPTITTPMTRPTFFEINGCLTGKERLRLQGFDDNDYNKIKKIVNETQLGYLTGNSITVTVLESILKNLCDEKYINNRQQFLSDWC